MSLYAKINIKATDPKLNASTDIFQGAVRDAIQNIISEAIGKTAHESDSLVLTNKEEMRRIAKNLYEQNKYEYILVVEEYEESLNYPADNEQLYYSFSELLRPDLRRIEKGFVDVEDSPLAPRAVGVSSKLNDGNFYAYVYQVSKGNILFGCPIDKIASIELSLE